MIKKAVDTDLMVKNFAKQINTVVSKEQTTKNNQPMQQFLIKECLDLILKNTDKDNIDIESFTAHATVFDEMQEFKKRCS